ncbi:ATP-binding protein [Brevundimonas sp.]|uniref:ATP-binding protein n=1 Tax=Brevundimonas sp. TaxID=1871086 RepID=UPI002869F59D|nr:ATP-binding protein [Brevundimonas sp.]
MSRRIKRLFTAFDRLGAERRSGAEGSGLGLALSRGLARAQGGDVLYRPRTDRSGAVFILDLIDAPSNTGDAE